MELFGEKMVGSRVMIRAAQLVAASAVVVVFAACSEPTSPEKAAIGEVPVTADARNPVATELGNWVVDATLWATPSLVDPTNRGKLESSINALAGHLIANNINQVKNDIFTVRSLITSGTFAEEVELGPIGISMDYIEYRLGLNS